MTKNCSNCDVPVVERPGYCIGKTGHSLIINLEKDGDVRFEFNFNCWVKGKEKEKLVTICEDCAVNDICTFFENEKNCDRFEQKTCGNCGHHGPHEKNRTGLCNDREWDLLDIQEAFKDCPWTPIKPKEEKLPIRWEYVNGIWCLILGNKTISEVYQRSSKSWWIGSIITGDCPNPSFYPTLEQAKAAVEKALGIIKKL